MGINYSDMVQDYLAKLDELTNTREGFSQELEQTWEMSYKTEDDAERASLVSQAGKLQKKIDDITSEGQQYILKIDRFNGVR